MTDISTFMTHDHRDCDNTFIEFENALSQQDWAKLTTLWQAFKSKLLHHFSMEEDILFPAFEAATGITEGPTRVMKMEHAQMRELLNNMESAMGLKDSKDCIGISETLMLIMQQHNMKEENMLYPMSDQHTDGPTLVSQMQAME